MTGLKLVALGGILTVGGLPVVAQITPESAAGELAKASAQGVLSIALVAVSVAMIFLFKGWRKDIEKHDEQRNEENKFLTKVVAQNTSALDRCCSAIEKCEAKEKDA